MIDDGWRSTIDLYLSVDLLFVDRPRNEGRQPLSVIAKRKLHGTGRAGAALANYEPDILAEGLEVVSCGINPATTASAAGHDFSNGSNRFWTALHLAGFTDRRLQPHE